jgi:hypothetical protein
MMMPWIWILKRQVIAVLLQEAVSILVCECEDADFRSAIFLFVSR